MAPIVVSCSPPTKENVWRVVFARFNLLFPAKLDKIPYSLHSTSIVFGPLPATSKPPIGTMTPGALFPLSANAYPLGHTLAASS